MKKEMVIVKIEKFITYMDVETRIKSLPNVPVIICMPESSICNIYLLVSFYVTDDHIARRVY